ncbi:MAG: class I adenylate-forming enzyme family protein [Acidimicrobiaceae bacterium]|nr:class I adenylate-forming enzyme family protein [Acidimicrobiaceae bacterium]
MTSEPCPGELIDDFNAAFASLTAPGAPFGWTTQEVNGVPVRVYDNAIPDMRAVWAMSAAHGDKDYLVYGGERYSYADAHARVRALAHHLRAAYGAGPGTRVAISMRNYPEWVLSHWAAISVGAAVVGMNSWWTRPEMEFALADCEPAVLIVDGERLERLGPARGEVPLIVTRHGGEIGGSALRWESVADPSTAPDGLPEVAIDPNDDALIFYTSGTTGSPKGAQLTHRAVVHNLMNMVFMAACGDAARAIRAARATDGDEPASPAAEVKALLPVPLFHVTGCNCVMHTVTIAGGGLVLMYRWDAATALRLIETEGVSVFTGVPSMSREMLQHPDWERTDTSSLRSMGGGGAAIPTDLVHRIDEGLAEGRPGVGYGLTETAGVATAISNEFYLARPSSVGPLVPCMEALVVDENGSTLGPGGRGELLLRGPNVMKGYLNQPDATAEAIVDGWFHTGDVAEIDGDGWIHIKDRIKDVVIRGGENVHCSEVEATIYELDEVAEAAVFGVPDERLGEEVAAAVVLVPGADLDAAGLAAHLDGRLARFKHPRHVRFQDEPLPRNANGKFLKRELRERFTRN